MKKLLTIALVVVCFFKNGASQNLILNASFEDTISCPTGNTGQMDKVVSWYQTTLGTPDYCHECKGTVPLSAAYQYARTGAAYTGIIVYWVGKPNYREYISVPLIGPLDTGKTYYAEMYVSLSNYSKRASDMMGIFLSNGSPDTTGVGSGVFPVTPQISNPTGNFLSDTVNWMKISGTFIANGGEDYITIGSFKDDAGTDTLYMGGGVLNSSYYVIEDVLVREDTAESVSEEKGIKSRVLVYPNPASGVLMVEIETLKQVQGDLRFELYDVMGRSVGNWQLAVGNNKVDVSDLTGGIYLWRFGEARGKVVIE